MVEINLEQGNQISFDESKFKIRSRSILGAPEVPSMIRVLVKYGIVKTEKRAVTVILVIIVLLMSVSVFLIRRSVSVPPASISPLLVSYNN